MRVLATVLTSYDVPRAVRAAHSILNQKNDPFDTDLIVFCNTINGSYADELRSGLGSDIRVVETYSDGTIGTGKQSVCNWFVAHEEYDAVVMIDGDDFFYPYAFSTMSEAVREKEADVIGLQSLDLLYDWEPDIRRMNVDGNYWIIGWFGEQNDMSIERDYKSINKPVGDQITPDRLVWFSRKMFQQMVRPWWPSALSLYEDFIASLCCLASHVHGHINYVQMCTSNIYVIDATEHGSLLKKYLSEGNTTHDMDQPFRDLYYPLGMLIGTKGFNDCIFHRNTHESEFTNEERVAFIRENII